MSFTTPHPLGVVMLIVENTFTHIADVAEVMFQIPGFNYIPRLVIHISFIHRNYFLLFDTEKRC